MPHPFAPATYRRRRRRRQTRESPYSIKIKNTQLASNAMVLLQIPSAMKNNVATRLKRNDHIFIPDEIWHCRIRERAVESKAEYWKWTINQRIRHFNSQLMKFRLTKAAHDVIVLSVLCCNAYGPSKGFFGPIGSVSMQKYRGGKSILKLDEFIEMTTRVAEEVKQMTESVSNMVLPTSTVSDNESDIIDEVASDNSAILGNNTEHSSSGVLRDITNTQGDTEDNPIILED